MDNDSGIACNRQGANCLISLTGRVTVDTSPELRALLMEQLQDATCSSLAIDFYEVEYVDTSVLAILVETLKAARACRKTFQLRRLRGRATLSVAGHKSVATVRRDRRRKPVRSP
ncbi:MAG: STAS domain-containing protein [Ignavibacteriota bacterium]